MDLDEAGDRLRGWLLGAARLAYPETEPLVEDEGGLPGAERGAVTVSTGAAGPPWDARAAVSAVRTGLVDGGWQADEVRHEGDRFDTAARRDGFVVVASMGQQEGILRLLGRTPRFAAPPPPAAAAGGGADWQPANDLERAIRVAVDRGDRQELLGLVRTGPLYLPTPGEPEPDGEPDVTSPFGTLIIDGGVHLVAFTSPESLVFSLGDGARSWTRVSYRALAEGWPDPGWRLTVNTGTPIEASFPAPVPG